MLIIILSCSSNIKKTKIDKIAKEYYVLYQERTDFEKFMSFYDENVILEDIISGERIIGKDSLMNFFNWNHSGFEKIESNSLVILDQIIKGDKVITRGYFTEFKWQNSKIEAMNFITVLIFNDSNKIVKQIDWINYPTSILDYSQRKNSNDWIKPNN